MFCPCPAHRSEMAKSELFSNVENMCSSPNGSRHSLIERLARRPSWSRCSALLSKLRIIEILPFSARYDQESALCLCRLYHVHAEHIVDFCLPEFAWFRSGTVRGRVDGVHVQYGQVDDCLKMTIKPQRPNHISWSLASVSRSSWLLSAYCTPMLTLSREYIPSSFTSSFRLACAELSCHLANLFMFSGQLLLSLWQTYPHLFPLQRRDAALIRWWMTSSESGPGTINIPFGNFGDLQETFLAHIEIGW